MLKFACCILACVLLYGCSGKSDQTVIERPGEPPVVTIESGDQEMRAAEKKAQETLPDFISALKRKPEGSVFSIKAGLPTSTGEIEHIWIDDPVYKDGTFTGTLGNEPIDIPGKKLGSVVRVTRDKVEDWIIMEGENMRGGYTVDVIAKRLQENGK